VNKVLARAKALDVMKILRKIIAQNKEFKKLWQALASGTTDHAANAIACCCAMWSALFDYTLLFTAWLPLGKHPGTPN